LDINLLTILKNDISKNQVILFKILKVEIKFQKKNNNNE
jgi:hypothetical protein